MREKSEEEAKNNGKNKNVKKDNKPKSLAEKQKETAEGLSKRQMVRVKGV